MDLQRLYELHISVYTHSEVSNLSVSEVTETRIHRVSQFQNFFAVTKKYLKPLLCNNTPTSKSNTMFIYWTVSPLKVTRKYRGTSSVITLPKYIRPRPVFFVCKQDN